MSFELPTNFLSATRRSTPSSDPPHVFIYVVDTMRADSLSPYGGKRSTPEVEAFARDGLKEVALAHLDAVLL